MKLLYSLLVLSFLFVSPVTATSGSKTVELIVKTEVFCNHCNHCESCKPRIETALFELTGVKQAKLDIESQLIRVVYNPKKTNEAEVINAILSSGYSANGTHPKAEDYAKLDGCCKRK